MSLRPRFGDEGMLRRPLGVRGEWDDEQEEWNRGWYVGALAPDRDWDPFERTESGLLLAESFARADLTGFDAASEWYIEHGALDLHGFLPGEDWLPYRDPEPTSDWFHDGRVDIVDQQHRVAWLLLTLARLSQGPEAWDPRWMEVVLHGAGDFLWLDLGNRKEIRFRRRRKGGEPIPAGTIWVPGRQWALGWAEIIEGREWDPADHSVLPLGADRDGLIELVRRLVEPIAREAAQFEVDLLWLRTELPMVVRERRRWRSVLAPVYLQLLEGLRRVSEGQRGAGFCRECGLPFLTLDARRSSFCTDKDRFRFSQRERRKRVDLERAARDAVAISDAATIHVEQGEPEGEPEA